MGASVRERFSSLSARRLMAGGTEELNMLLKTSQERSELVEVMTALRREAIDFEGPFRTGKGRIVFRMGHQIVLESELVELQRSGKLSATGVAALLRGLRAR